MAGGCEFEFMEYMDENSIDPNLICSICHKALKDPVCTPCDHTYGRACITRWLNENKNRSCPTCLKQSLSINELTQANRLLRNMLDQIRVQCTLCGQTGLQRGNFVDHINKICSKASVQCQAADIKCPWEGLRDELPTHVSTCVFEPLRPVLASLIAENRRLTDQVQEHDHEIRNLTQKMSKLDNTATNDSGDESDDSSVSEVSSGNIYQKEENAIFIRKLPANVKFNDVFELFSKVGRIKYNAKIQKADLFIFKNPTVKDGFCNAKVTYTDKAMADAAVAEFNQKHIPQWNTRLLVSISSSKKTNVKDFEKVKSGNVTLLNEASASLDHDEDVNKNQKVFTIVDQPQTPTEPDPSQSTTKNNPRHRRGPRHHNQPTNKN